LLTKSGYGPICICILGLFDAFFVLLGPFKPFWGFIGHHSSLSIAFFKKLDLWRKKIGGGEVKVVKKFFSRD